MGNHTHTIATLNPLHHFYFCWIKFLTLWSQLLSVTDLFYHWSPSLQTYRPILYQSPDSSTEFGTNLYSWLDCKRNQRIVKPWREKVDFGMLLYANLCPSVLVEDFLVLWSPNMKPAWQLSNKAALAAGTAAEAGLRKAKPGLVWDHPNFQKFWEAKASNWKLWLHLGSSNFTFRRCD